MTFRKTFTLHVNAHLLMRVLTPADAAVVFATIDRNRAHLGRWFQWVEGTRKIADSEAFIRKSLEQLADETDVVFGMFHDGEYLGNIGLHSMKQNNNSGMIGYWLSASAQHRGIVTACVRTLLAYAFEVRQLNRVWLFCDVDNARSQAVAERAGLVREGTFREFICNNGFRDAHFYAILRRDWNKG